VALSGIPSWIDQDIELYHGTLQVHMASLMIAVDVTRGASLKDFGRGFYTTTIRAKPRAWSQKAANRLRARIEAMPKEEMELFYHAEPFDVACSLVKHQLDMKNFLSRYLQIRDAED
jgi:hypothetical protein